MRDFFLLTFLLVSVFEANASQGFHDDLEGLPKLIQRWSTRTYMVYSEEKKTPVGSAFLVHGDHHSGLHFITAKHVADHCVGPGTCSLRLGGMWDASTREQVIPPQITLSVIDNNLFETENPNWKVGLVTAGDMAHFRTEFHPDVAPANIQDLGLPVLATLPAAVAYQRHHYVLGYPYLARRPSLRDLPSSTQMQLRWSEGDFIEKQKKGPKYELHTDADSLGGNSGGPVINEDGTLLGILYGGPTGDYVGFPKLFSYVVPIDNVRYLIGDLLLKKKNHIPICQTAYGKNKPACQKQPGTS